MAFTVRPYSIGIKNLLDKKMDVDSDSFKIMLLLSGYTPNYDTHDFQDDLTNEVSNVGTGYTTGGTALTSVALAVIAANSWATARANSTAYTLGQIVRPATGNGFLYQASVAGTSAGSIPTYPTVVGGTVTDGGVTWTCVGRTAVQVDAADWSLNPATLTARYAAIVDTTPGSAATNYLLALADFGADVSPVANELKIQWSADGVLVFVIQ